MKNTKLPDILNKRITIEENINIPDGFGGYVVDWQKIKTVWAEILPINQIEIVEGNRLSEKVTHLIKIRFMNGLKTTYRILYKNRIFNIKSIINIDENNEVLEIKVEEIQLNVV